MERQIPSIGRVVHYYASETQRKPFAAIVTDVHSEVCVNLAGFNHGNTAVAATSVCHSEDPAAGQRWCWPPRT